MAKKRTTRRTPTKTPDVDSTSVAHARPELPQPKLQDYWTHELAEAVKRKVLTYFAIVGLLVSVVVSLFGMDRIRAVIDEQYSSKIQAKENEATERIAALSRDFEERLAAKESAASQQVTRVIEQFESRIATMEAKAQTRAREFHTLVGVTLARVRATPATQTEIAVDLSSEIGPIRDQGPDSTTVGFALAYALQAELTRNSDDNVLPSARSIYVEARKHDELPGEDYEGSSVEGGMIGLQKTGAYSEEDWPYGDPAPKANAEPKYKIADYTLFPGSSIELILDALRKGKTVVASIDVDTGFGEVGDDGIVTVSEDDQVIGGHAICIVGYSSNTKLVKFANMWGTGWGAKGFGYISRDDLEKILQSAATLRL